MSFSLIHSVVRMSTIVLVMMCGGCGPVSDETTGSQSPPAAGIKQADKTNATDVLQTVDSAAQEIRVDGRANRIETADQSTDRNVPSELSIPHSVLTDLVSREARTRLRALEHWEQKDGKIALDAVFEALEDEDEAVRAKAEAIVEQRWAAE